MTDHTTHSYDQILIDYLKGELTRSKWITVVTVAMASLTILVNTDSPFVQITWGLITAAHLYLAAMTRRHVRRVENP